MLTPFDQGYFKEEELKSMGFKAVGENVAIAKNCTIIGLQNISIGSNVRIDSNVSIAAHKGGLDIGSYVHIGGACHLSCAGTVSLADFSGLSQGVRIYSSTDDYSGQFLTNPMVPTKYLNVEIAPVTIGKHVVVGSGSVVLPGVYIGEGSSVGALSLVTKNLGEWGVYFGAPVKLIKFRSKQLLDLEKEFSSE